MKKLVLNLKAVNKLSLHILRCGVIVWTAFIFSFAAIRYTYLSSRSINLVQACCLDNYPLLAFMSLSLSITGALLIDIYDKTQM